ncbi:MAG: DUF1501 domain-containing protein [Planctomycetota bacterium]|nr:MAG: DUF1501 domain-containing protein [Planctomycetota bacterium]
MAQTSSDRRETIEAGHAGAPPWLGVSETVGIGRLRARTCSGFDRRSMLRIGVGLPTLLLGGRSIRPAAAATVPRARSVILLWLWGAPSHLDTFDPKPQAPPEYRGPFATIPTRILGVHFTELLPRTAARSDRLALVRSMAHDDGGHPSAGTLALTGFRENPEPVQPNFGSILAKHARRRGWRGQLPPFFAIGPGIPRDVVRRIKGYGGGILGRQYDPVQVQCTPGGEVNIPALKLLEGLTPHRIVDRRSLLRRLDRAARLIDATASREWDRTWQTAYRLLTERAARRAFDLTEEPEPLRASYGYTSFGQSCLLARRLVEVGVRYVQVNWSEYVEAMTPKCDFGWDTHIYNFELLQDRHCPIFDRAFSGLLDDLHDRGLLHDTLVVAMGEFGRTPRINKRAARDHWPRCYFSIWAGAGIRPGIVVGESDKRGENPVEHPVSPLMVGTTIAELAGMRVQDRSEMNVLPNGTVIHELLV